MTIFKFQYLIIFSVYLYLKFSSGFPYELYNGAKIITYGEPCYSIRYLSGKIEEPVLPMAKELTLLKVYQPLRLNYQAIQATKPVSYQLQAKYPISIEIPEVPQPLEIVMPDTFRGKSYEYNVQIPPSPPMSISRNYDFDVQIPLPPLTTIPKYSTTKFLTNLTTKIDKILISACEMPSHKTYASYIQ